MQRLPPYHWPNWLKAIVLVVAVITPFFFWEVVDVVRVETQVFLWLGVLLVIKYTFKFFAWLWRRLTHQTPH